MCRSTIQNSSWIPAVVLCGNELITVMINIIKLHDHDKHAVVDI